MCHLKTKMFLYLSIKTSEKKTALEINLEVAIT